MPGDPRPDFYDHRTEHLEKLARKGVADGYASLDGTGKVPVSQIPSGGSGAPVDSQYLVLLADATLTGERVLTLGTGLLGTDAGPGLTYTLSFGFAGAEQGDVLYRSAVAWTLLHHGNSGEVLTSGGHAANPSWIAPTVYAPTSSQYLTLAADAGLSNERVLTPGTGILYLDDGAGGHYHISLGFAGEADGDVAYRTGGTWTHTSLASLADPAGTAHSEASAHVTTHEGAADPHTGYVREGGWTVYGLTGTDGRVAGWAGGVPAEVVIGSGAGQVAPGDHLHGGVYAPVGTWIAAGLTGTDGYLAGWAGGVPSTYQIGAGAGTVCSGNDARLSDARTPLSHQASHVSGADQLANLTDSHIAAANKDGVAGTACLRTLGNGAQQACAGNDARLSDARTPTTHVSTHKFLGSDFLNLRETSSWRCPYWYRATLNNTFIGTDGSAYSTYGTATYVTGTTAVWCRHTAAVGDGAAGGRAGGNVCQRLWSHRPVFRWRVMTCSDLTTSTYFIGLIKTGVALPTKTGVYTSDHAVLRWVAGTDVNFQWSSADGTTQSIVDAGVAPAASTEYWIEIDGSVAGQITFTLCDSSGTPISGPTVKNTNVPLDATTVVWYGVVFNAAVVIQRYLDIATVWEDSL